MKTTRAAVPTWLRQTGSRMGSGLWIFCLGATGLMLSGCHYYDDYPRHHRAAYSGHGHSVDPGDYSHHGYYDAPHHSDHGDYDEGYDDDY